MQPVRREDLLALDAPLERARPLPASVYLDPDVLSFERATIFRDCWLAAGRESEATLPGAFYRPPLPHDVIVARGADLELRAFYNVCRHRASPLTCEAHGRTARFECPYHGWTYELDGRLHHAAYAPSDFDPDAHGLLPLDLAKSSGFVFCRANRGPRPRSENDQPWAGAPPWLRETELRHLVRAHQGTWISQANWKLLVENFQESHHFARVHRDLERLTPNEGARSWLEGSTWLGGIMPIAPHAETVSSSGLRRARPYIVGEARRGSVHDAVLFPTLLTSLQPDYFLTYRLVPEAVDRTRVVFDIYVHPEAQRSSESGLEEVVAFWSRVNEEDRAICEGQQRGMATPDYRPACFATVEDGVHAFQKLVASAYARSTP